jgi:hypothetical protein
MAAQCGPGSPPRSTGLSISRACPIPTPRAAAGVKGPPRDRTPTASLSPATSPPWSPDRLSGTDRSRDAALQPSTGERDSRDAKAKKHPGAQLRGGGDRIAQLHPADPYRGVLYDFTIRAQPNDGLQIRFFRPGAEDGAELEVQRAGGIGKRYLVARPVADRSVCPGLLPKSANEDVPEDELEPGGSILNVPLRATRPSPRRASRSPAGCESEPFRTRRRDQLRARQRPQRSGRSAVVRRLSELVPPSHIRSSLRPALPGFAGQWSRNFASSPSAFRPPSERHASFQSPAIGSQSGGRL